MTDPEVRVFVSYRRDDVPAATDLLTAGLRSRLGKDNVFRDIDSIEPGADFEDVIGDWVARCRVFLAVIGDRWLEKPGLGGRRIDDAGDYVRLEIEAAIEASVRLVPIQIYDAILPVPIDLPESVRPLLRKNAVQLSRMHWDDDLKNLLDWVESLPPPEVTRAVTAGTRGATGRTVAVDPGLRHLNVCMFSSEYPPRMFGGLGAHVEQLTAALGQQIDVKLILPSSGSDEYQEPPTKRVALKALLQSNPSYGSPLSWLRFANAAADRLNSIISEDGESVDVIHCHDWVTVLAGIKCRWRHDIPLVFHLHLPNRAPLCASVENLGLACADLITVSSEAMRQELRSRIRVLHLDDKPIHVVPNGVDTNTFQPRPDWPADDGYVLFVGRLVQQKGVEYLLRAFYYVLQRFPDLKLKLVGTGTLDSQLDQLARNLMFSEQQVEFIRPYPWFSRRQMAQLYQGARVVVIPSIYEPFGMTALEALACQRPVVASRVGGLRDIVKHDVNGFLAEPRDELDLAQWLMTLLADDTLRERLGTAGRDGLSADYSWPEIARQVIKMYGRLQAAVDRQMPHGAEAFITQIKDVAWKMDPGSSGEVSDLFDWGPVP